MRCRKGAPERQLSRARGRRRAAPLSALQRRSPSEQFAQRARRAIERATALVVLGAGPAPSALARLAQTPHVTFWIKPYRLRTSTAPVSLSDRVGPCGRVPFRRSVMNARDGIDAMSGSRHKIRAPHTPICVSDASFRGNQSSPGLAHRGALEVPSRRMPAFVMPMPVARRPLLLTPVPRQAERNTSVPPPTARPRHLGRTVPEPPTSPKEAVRRASLPPITEIPRPCARTAPVNPPFPEPAVHLASLRPSLPPVTNIPRPCARTTPVSLPEEPFELRRKRAAR